MAGMTAIDAIVFSAYEQDSAVIAMMENLQRENCITWRRRRAIRT